MSKESPSAVVSPKLEFDDCDIDDELDPAMKEELDRYRIASLLIINNYRLWFCPSQGIHQTYCLTA